MDYFSRIQNSIDYIEDNLYEKIQLDEVCKQSSFSTTHFYRLFQAVVGDTLKEYIRKRRLSAAAQALLETDKRVIDIALEYQFESEESFSRAFQRVYGNTPGRYRKNGKELVLFEKANINKLLEEDKYEGISLEPKVVFKNNFNVIGMEYHATLEEVMTKNSIQRFWEEMFVPRMGEIKSRVGDYAIGYEKYNPQETKDIYHLACFEVSEIDEIPQGMVVKSIPRSKYVVFSNVNCSPEISGKIIDYAFGVWLPHSSYELAGDYTFDIYRSYNPTYELYIPIK